MFTHFSCRKNLTNNFQCGFIALISTMIISSVLLGLVFVNNVSSFMLRRNVLNYEYKFISLADAESCVNLAQFKISQNYNYSGSETFDLGGRFCTIHPIVYVIDHLNHKKTATVNVQGKYNNTFSNLRVILDVVDPGFMISGQAQIKTISRSES